VKNRLNKDKKLILIVEDDKAYGDVYQLKLEKEGYQVKILEGRDFVARKLEKHLPNLLILDLIMPEKSGFEILEEIHANSHLKNLKILIVSNLSQDIDQEKARKFGIQDYFVKSDISIAKMVEKIRAIVGD